MPKFVLVYHGSPKFETKEEGQNHMTAWRAWSQGLGDAVVDPGMPFGPSKTILQDGSVVDGATDPAAGFTVLQAESMDAAIALAKPCPHISAGGSIEVVEGLNMEM